MKTVGVLGGMSPQATMDFEARVPVEGVVLGCTEIPLLLGEEAQANDLVNPSALLAEAAVRLAVGETARVC